MANERRVAGFTISDGTNDVGRILGYSLSTEVSEEEVAGLNDTVGDPPIISEQYIATSVGKTASLNGISIINDDGQSAVETAAETGDTMTLEYRYEDGSGYDLEGFFTSHEKTGEKPDTEKFSAEFRVNSKTEVTTS
jgi:hypothetical protein